MNRFVYFMAVGLAFTVLQVATVSAADVSCAKLADGSLPPHCQKGNSEGGSGEAQDTAAGLVTGGNAPADCGGVPCTTGDDTHTGGAQDCANLKNADGSKASPDAVAICWKGQSSDGSAGEGGGDGCAAEETPALVAACVAKKTSGGEDRDSEADQREQENRDRDRERTEREESR